MGCGHMRRVLLVLYRETGHWMPRSQKGIAWLSIMDEYLPRSRELQHEKSQEWWVGAFLSPSDKNGFTS